MNNGVKAEKENTPNEANLQEEEVLTEWLCAVAGATRDPSRAFPPVRAAGRGRWSRGAAVQGLGIAPDCSPGRVSLRRVCFCGCVPKIA